MSAFRNITDPNLDTFSVNDALSKFFADVLPQRIDAGVGQEAVLEVTPEEKICDKLDGDDSSKSTMVTFETPELSISLEDSCFLREEKMQFFFEGADTEFCPDLHDFSLGVQQLMDVQKSILSVEDISVEFQEEHRSDFFEDASLSKGQISSNLRTFPLFEVDETSLGINSYISEDKHIIFESDEPQQWIQKDESTCDASELLISMEFNLLEHLLNHRPVTCHKFEVPCVNFGTEDDIVHAIDLGDGYSSFKLGPFAFEQFEFVDTNTSHFSEVFFNTEIISEVEPVEQMYGDTSLSTFNRLIVTHEIILRDDSFKSLPVPLISDHEKILSLQAIVDELFMKLKLQPSSTSDGIYLDWHLLEEDISSQIFLKMFENIDTYCIDADMNSCDSHILIRDFVLSDTCSNKQTIKEQAEVLNIEMSENLKDPVCRDVIASSKLNVPCQKMASGEVILDNKVDRNDQRVESMSHFDDLDFFLNPSEATCVKKPKHADKNPGMDYTLPANSAKNPIEIQDTSYQQQQSLETEFHPRGDLHSTSILNESSNNSEGPLHSKPVDEIKMMNSSEATHMQAPQEASVMEPKRVNRNTPTLPDVIIIVNTQNADTGMIISRRTTYQRILAMEKEGVQVVERDLNLPVDVIVSAAVCLVLYDSKNISKKTNSSDSGSSLLSSCIENIAANILTSLSFAFSSCILIFEGEVGFLSGIMESSDELYAAAAGLGMDLQLFCSYSSEISDEIILSSIAHAAKSTRGVYPKMPELETLAESFLSKFPSLNPLSAHVILSAVGTLVDFLEMTHKQRVRAVEKYLVSDASIALFSALCRYGEREDSRSGTTDCCSSVSSGYESGNCCPKSDHEKKKRKYTGRSPELNPILKNNMFQSEKNNDVKWDPPKTDNSHNYWNLETEEVSEDYRMSNRAFDEIYFGENQRSDPRTMLNRSNLTETSFGQRKKVHMPIVDRLGSHAYNNSKGLHDGFKAEVIDIDDEGDVAGDDFSFVHRNKISPGWCSLPTFPTAAEISSDLDSWIPTKDNGYSFSEGFAVHSHTDFMNNSTPLEECSIVDSPLTFSRPPSQETDPCYGRTPLSKAIFSAQPEKGSPWTMDFLNRIKEKSRMRHQSLPNVSSAPCFGSSGNSSKFRKRKNLSILDFYSYQRSSTSQSMEHKGQKVPVLPPSSSKSVKRAKRKLTFASNGSKGQSKLICSDKTNQTPRGRL